MKKINVCKVLFVLGMFLVFSCKGYSQVLRTSYFMEASHYRMQLNPALTPSRGYINLPVIGSFNATVNSSSLGFQDIKDIANNDEGDDYFMSNDFINRLENINNLNFNLSTDVLSAGWYKGKNFWSFNIGLRNDIGASIPKSMFEFLREMDGLSVADYARLSNINERVDKMSFEINSYAEIGIGWARDITDKLSVGARVKALLGVGNLEMNVNDISVKSSLTGYEDIDWNNPSWGDIDKIQGAASVNVDATLESSSKLIELSQENGNDYIDDIEFGSFGVAGFGASIDFGVSYRLLDRLTLSASVLDLGFINWSKKYTSIAKAKASQSYDLRNESDRYEFVDMVSSGEILNYDMLQMTVDKSAEESRKSTLSSTVVVGAEYELLGDWLAIGALYTGRFIQPETLNELTFSANIRPKNYFNLSLSYSVLQGLGKTFGVAAKLGALFIGTDYMFLGENTKNLNAYVGVSIPLNKRNK